MEFPVNSLIAVLFYPQIAIENGVSFANAFIQKTGTALDHEPVVLPLKQPLPPDAPRIVLRSLTGAFVCEFALNRVVFRYESQGQRPERIESLFPRYRETLYKVITALYEMVETRPMRLGFVAKILKQTARASSDALIGEFVSGGRFDGAVETHLHFLHLIDLEGTPCNRWVRFRTLRPASAGAGPENLALFEVDLNTRAEYQHVFEAHEVISFYLEGYEDIRAQADRLLVFSSDG